MTANDSTPGLGESPSGEQSADWESLGRAFLAETLEYRGDRLRSVWMEIAQKAKKGEPVTRRDWIHLSDELQQFAFLVEQIEEATRPEE
jgi:hypothetical protein